MKLLKAILETVTEKLLDICDGAVDLFKKGCEPDSFNVLWGWLTEKVESQSSEFSPVVPYGGF